MTSFHCIIYGASGFTGRLLAEEAVRRGHRPKLCGRSAEKLRPLAERLGLDWEAAGLEDRGRLRQAIQGMDLVFHSAGPFIETSRPMLSACLEAGVHYLDITGEIPVFQNTLSLDQAAQRRGVALISGCGFDVIPSDCLASYVSGKVPRRGERSGIQLDIAIASLSRPSAGTVQSMLEMLPRGGLVRRDGMLVQYPLGQGARGVRFSDRERLVLPIPWGDLETAYHTTGIPNITTYMVYPQRMIWMLRMSGSIGRVAMSLAPLRRFARLGARRLFRGPDESLQQHGRSYLWAQAAAPDGRCGQAWLETCEAYRFTALAGVRCMEKLMERPLAGALTPAQAFGPDFVLEIEGTRRFDAL